MRMVIEVRSQIYEVCLLMWHPGSGRRTLRPGLPRAMGRQATVQGPRPASRTRWVDDELELAGTGGSSDARQSRPMLDWSPAETGPDTTSHSRRDRRVVRLRGRWALQSRGFGGHKRQSVRCCPWPHGGRGSREGGGVTEGRRRALCNICATFGSEATRTRPENDETPAVAGVSYGAGEENRTPVFSLGSCSASPASMRNHGDHPRTTRVRRVSPSRPVTADPTP